MCTTVKEGMISLGFKEVQPGVYIEDAATPAESQLCWDFTKCKDHFSELIEAIKRQEESQQ